MRRNCKASVMLYPKGSTTMWFTTNASTKDEILADCGKALARQDIHDAISVWGIEVEWPESKTPFKTKYFTADAFADHDIVFAAYHNERKAA